MSEFNKRLFVVVAAQCVREPVPAEDASLGERVAAGSHLPLHVSPLPDPLCGASSSEKSFFCLTQNVIL